MVEDNKIISFSTIRKKDKSKNNKIMPFNKNRRESHYYLKYELSIYLCIKTAHYIADWSTKDNISNHEIYMVLKSIFSKIENKLPSTMSKRKRNYEITFSLLYYENEKDVNDFRYICTTPNITNEQLSEYLLFVITMYESKNPEL